MGDEPSAVREGGRAIKHQLRLRGSMVCGSLISAQLAAGFWRAGGVSRELHSRNGHSVEAAVAGRQPLTRMSTTEPTDQLLMSALNEDAP